MHVVLKCELWLLKQIITMKNIYKTNAYINDEYFLILESL